MTTNSKFGIKGTNKIFVEDTSETLNVKSWIDGQYLFRNGSEIISGNINDMSNFDGGFSALKTTLPQRKFSSKHVGALNNQFQYVTTGSASITYNQVEAVADLSVPAGDTAIIQSFEYIIYVEGRIQETIFTGVLSDSAVANGAIVRYGIFDSNVQKIPYSIEDRGGDGHFFQFDNSGLSVVERKSTGIAPFQSETQVLQASFNVDPLDGTGPSGVTFDPTNSYLFVTRVAWLGVGNVEMGIYGPNNSFYPVHRFEHAGLTTTYMKRASLPIRYEIDNTGGSGTINGKQICVDSSLLGSEFPLRRIFTYDRIYTQPASQTHAFTIRLAPAHNRDLIVPYSVTTDGSSFNSNEILELRVLINATPSGPLTFAPSALNPQVEIATNNVTFTGGSTYIVRYVSGKNSRVDRPVESSLVGISSLIDGTPMTMTFLTDEVVGSVGNVYMTFAYEQLR